MPVNTDTPPKSFGTSSSPSPTGNPGMVSANSKPHLQGQTSGQSQIGAGFPGQFQLSQAQAQAFAAQSKTQAQGQAQPLHAQLQAQLQAKGLSLHQSQTMGIANFGSSSSSPAMNTPGNVSAKRALPKPLGRPPVELTASARKKKQKLPEKQLQYRVAALLPESALYTQLLEFESRVDGALGRKKFDIQEALKLPPRLQKTLRIYVFNTFANQEHTIPNKPNAEPPTWTLKVTGRILEDGANPNQPAAMQNPSSVYPKFTSFLKRVSISLDQRLYPDSQIILWEQARSPAPLEGLEVKRKGDREFTANIRLEMNYAPEKFKLSPPLKEVLGIEVDTRQRVIAALWHYVKARNLQSPNDPSCFACDPPLRRVFGEEKMKFIMVSQKISPHLSPPHPILLEHQIRLSGNNPAGHACYDVLVDVPFLIQSELSAILANTEKSKEIENCDEAICTAIKKIHEHRKRRAFFLGFSQSPVEFINALINSQSRDLKLVAGEPIRNAEKERRSDFFSQPWVDDAIIQYLNRKSAGGTVTQSEL